MAYVSRRVSVTASQVAQLVPLVESGRLTLIVKNTDASNSVSLDYGSNGAQMTSGQGHQLGPGGTLTITGASAQLDWYAIADAATVVLSVLPVAS